MLFVGITGGVGAGKTEILHYIEQTYLCRVLLADEIAHDLMEPGSRCYGPLRDLLAAEDVWLDDGQFDRPKLAAVLFSDDEKREAVNGIVHPAVKDYVEEQAALEKKRAQIDLLVLEAALLIEENYNEICDELWYIYTSEEHRAARLKCSRGYSDAKVDSIMASQLSEAAYRAHCVAVIDNNGTPEEAFCQVDALMEKRGIRTR